MRTYKVTTPTAGYNGEVGGVYFVNGAAVVEAPAPLAPLPYSDDEDGQLTRRQLTEREEIGQHPGYRAMSYFRQAGYGVEDITPDTEAAPDDADADSTPIVPSKSASTEVWRAFAKQAGMPVEQADSLTRDQLVEHYTKEGLL